MRAISENRRSSERSLARTVLQGEFKISGDPNVMMTTLLGSCIAACFWDSDAQVGGMNHFLLPAGGGADGTNLRFGVNAMELLLNGLLARGAVRSRLQVRLFGGAKMYDTGQSIGQQNVEFAKWFLGNENICITNLCVGGTRGRKIRFWPTTGFAQRMYLDGIHDNAISQPSTSQPAPAHSLRPEPHGDVELF